MKGDGKRERDKKQAELHTPKQPAEAVEKSPLLLINPLSHSRLMRS
jgi:hypothetical protein